MLQTNQEQFSAILGVKGLLNCITLVSDLKVDRKSHQDYRFQKKFQQRSLLYLILQD